ncbi:MAG: GIDE domain-containing protein, partial [Pseudonocardia sp.]
DEGISLGPLRIGGRTLGFEHTEWRIAPGQRITVIGEARDTGTGVRVAAGPDQPLTLTTDDRSEHIRAEQRRSRDALMRAVGYGSGALVALVLAFVL